MAVPTGTVSIVDTITSTTLVSGTLDAAGSATLTWTAVTGTYNLVAQYGGDSAFGPGTSAAVPYTVTAVLGKVTVILTATPPSPQTSGTAVSFTSTVTAA